MHRGAVGYLSDASLDRARFSVLAATTWYTSCKEHVLSEVFNGKAANLCDLNV